MGRRHNLEVLVVVVSADIPFPGPVVASYPVSHRTPAALTRRRLSPHVRQHPFGMTTIKTRGYMARKFFRAYPSHTPRLYQILPPPRRNVNSGPFAVCRNSPSHEDSSTCSFPSPLLSPLLLQPRSTLLDAVDGVRATPAAV